jgi:hypothetical protein
VPQPPPKPRQPRAAAPSTRRRASTPPALASGAGAELLGIGVGSRVQGNWGGGGYWHPATVMDLLPGGAYVLQYDDGLEERATADCVRLPAESKVDGASAMQSAVYGGGGLGGGGLGGGGLGGGGLGGEYEPKKGTPLAPRRRSSSRINEAEKMRRDFEKERKAPKIEVFKLKQEDRRWAEQHPNPDPKPDPSH